MAYEIQRFLDDLQRQLGHKNPIQNTYTIQVFFSLCLYILNQSEKHSETVKSRNLIWFESYLFLHRLYLLRADSPFFCINQTNFLRKGSCYCPILFSLCLGCSVSHWYIMNPKASSPKEKILGIFILLLLGTCSNSKWTERQQWFFFNLS